MPITLQGYSNTDFSRSANSTLVDFITSIEVDVLRAYAFGALLESQGRIVYNCDGRGLAWPIQYKLHDVRGNTGEGTRNFARSSLHKWANLEYRGYEVTDAMTRKELDENSGKSGLIKIWDGFTERMQQSMKQALGPEYFIDGAAANNETNWHGLETMFGVNGTVNVSTGAQQAYSAADYVFYPSGTYAGIATDLGTYGGANETGVIWPEGIADPEWDFWTPLIVNYTSTAFSGTADTFAAQGDEAIRWGLLHAQRNSSAAGQVSQVFLNRTLFGQFKTLAAAKEQINVNRNDSDGLVSLGFRNVINFDGVEITYENAVPAGVGYGVSMAAVELRTMHDKMFQVEGPTWDMRERSYIAAVSTLSNLRFHSPRNFIKWRKQ
jgi:hypothetical protein